MTNPRSGWRAALGALVVATLLVACGDGGDDDAAGSSPALTFPSTITPSPPRLTAGATEKAAPRWEELTTLAGVGPLESKPFAVGDAVIQWRVKVSCQAGRLEMSTIPPPPKPRPVVTTSCPGTAEGFSIQTGQLRLAVDASGPWKATVEQQVDTPIDEPPLPGMETAPVLAQGTFYNVDKTGGGSVRLYRLPDGQRALRFSDDFKVLNDTNLVVWLSEVPNPKTSAEVVEGPHVEIAPLKSTRGPQNYIVPPHVPTERIKSVALYCVPVPSIYIAAALA